MSRLIRVSDDIYSALEIFQPNGWSMPKTIDAMLRPVINAISKAVTETDGEKEDFPVRIKKITEEIIAVLPQALSSGEIKNGSEIIKNDLKLKNAALKNGDWYHPSQEDINVYDGIVSFQTLSWLPGYKEEIACLAKLNPKWIAISSLFFEGQIDFDIKIHEYDRKDSDGSRDSYYNIYSLPKVREEFDKNGYHNFEFFKFDIDIDIPQLHPNHMGTYTQKTEDGKRLQISGPLLMPWYFIVASK